ncbi:MAG: DMT family transporter [Promethearchaeota archaeon]
MKKEDLKKGLIFGTIGIFLIGLQPIVANSRPSVLDFYIFAAMTVIIEALLFLPLMLIERKKIKSDFHNNIINLEEFESLLYGYKNNKLLLLFVGSAFGFGMILFFIGYQLAGAINGSLAQKSTIFFSLIFGAILLREKISKIQIIFSLILFFGLILAVTQGSFNLLELNIGVVIIIMLSSIWMLAHTFTKPMFDRKETTPIQMVFFRNIIGGMILISTYFIFFPLKNAELFLDPVNIFWFIAMGTVYGSGLFCWYKTLENLDVNKASILVSPTPIITALFAMIFLDEIFTIYHFIGTALVIISIIIIMNPWEKKKEEEFMELAIHS